MGPLGQLRLWSILGLGFLWAAPGLPLDTRREGPILGFWQTGKTARPLGPRGGSYPVAAWIDAYFEENPAPAKGAFGPWFYGSRNAGIRFHGIFQVPTEGRRPQGELTSTVKNFQELGGKLVLWERHFFHFPFWALGLVGAQKTGGYPSWAPGNNPKTGGPNCGDAWG